MKAGLNVVVAATVAAVGVVLLVVADDFSESDFVNVRKIPLMRRKISLKQEDIGPYANYGSSCNLSIYDACRKPIYAANASKSIYERSDLLLQLIRDITKMWKDKSKNTTASCWPSWFSYSDICGSNHLMACVATAGSPCCKCMDEEASVYPQYVNMTKVEVGQDPVPFPFPPANYSYPYYRKLYECRANTTGSTCNTPGYVYCGMNFKCVNAQKSYQCECQPVNATDPADFSYIEDDNLAHFKIPKNTCKPKPRGRIREWQ